MRESTIRQRLVRVLNSLEPDKQIENKLINVLIGQLDGIVIEYRSCLGDMGIPVKVIDKLVRRAKKRL